MGEKKIESLGEWLKRILGTAKGKQAGTVKPVSFIPPPLENSAGQAIEFPPPLTMLDVTIGGGNGQPTTIKIGDGPEQLLSALEPLKCHCKACELKRKAEWN